MLRSFNERGIVKEYTHDIFDPYKLLRSDLSGRYFIEDITKLKKVMKRDFNDFPDDLFGVLDISIISHTLDPFTEQKNLSNIIEYLSKIPVREEIKLYNEEPSGFPKDNMNYIINEDDAKGGEVYKNGASFQPGRKKTVDEIYKSYIIESSVDRGFSFEDVNSSFGVGAPSTTKELKDYFQGVSILYTFYASNGTIYNAQVKLDDTVIEITQPHLITGALEYRKNSLVRYTVKAIMGASVFAVNPDGTIFDYMEQMVEPTGDAEYYGQGGEGTPKTFEEKEPYLNRKVLLQIYFKSHITTNNALKEQSYSIEDMKKEMIVKNEVDIVDSKYNFRRNRVITRAAYLAGDTYKGKNSSSYIDALRLHRGWRWSEPFNKTYYYNVGAHWLIDNYGIISGYGEDNREFTWSRGFPSDKDLMTDWRWSEYTSSRDRWRGGQTYVSFIEHDPDLNRLIPTAGNGYGFYADLYGPEYAENNVHRGAYFRIELKGEVPEVDPVRFNLPIGGTMQKFNTHGSISNVPIRNDTFSRTPSSVYRETHWGYPYRENHKYISVSYPCVNWFSFPWHRRGFDKSTVIDINNAMNYNARYKYVQCMYAVESPNWNYKDINLVVWLQSRSSATGGARMMFGFALEKEDGTSGGYLYERSCPTIWISAIAF